MFAALASVAKFLTLVLACLESGPVYAEESEAAVAVQEVAGGIIVSIDVHAKLWTVAVVGACLQDALADAAE